MSELRLVRRFQKKFELVYRGAPRLLPTETFIFRLNLLKEEIQEYEDAVNEGNLEKIFDAIIDIDYVLKGMALLHGFKKYRKGFRRVHKANMKKVKSELDTNGIRGYHDPERIIKPIGWKAPDLSDLVK